MHLMSIMHHLRMTYNVKCSASIGAAKREYMGFYLDEDESILEHIQTTRRVLDELQELHVEVGDEEKRQNFIHSLGPVWNGFVGVLEVSPTFDNMLACCQTEAIRREQQKWRRSSSGPSSSGKTATAFNAEQKTNKRGDPKQLQQKKNMSKVKCFNCTQMGHFTRDCTGEHVTSGIQRERLPAWRSQWRTMELTTDASGS